MNQNDSNETVEWLITGCKTSSHDGVVQMYNLIREWLLYISTEVQDKLSKWVLEQDESQAVDG